MNERSGPEMGNIGPMAGKKKKREKGLKRETEGRSMVVDGRGDYF